MASDDSGEKSELPTEHRRTQARERGSVAKSADLGAATVLLSATAALYFFGPDVATYAVHLLQGTLQAPWEPRIEIDTFAAQAKKHVQTFILVLLPPLAVVMASGLVVNFGQVGFLITPQAIAPQWERLSPLSGLQRIFSIASIVRLLWGIAKILLLGVIASVYLLWRFPQYWSLADQGPAVIMTEAGRSVIDLGLFLAVTLFVLALFDYGFQYWKHEQDLRMTKQELREELKEMEGDPTTRSRRRDAHRRLTQSRQMQAVPNADVIITNPTELAIAIEYNPEKMSAPTIVAKGAGEVAAHIRRIAAQHGVPIIERKPLAQALYRSVKVGQTIPVEMYEAFVEIMAYVYRLTGRKPPGAI